MGNAVSCGAAVVVRQFLAPERAGEFDEVFRLHRELASKRPGFVQLRRLIPADRGHDNEVVVVMEFRSRDELLAWRSSEDHAAIAKKYRRLWAREPVVEFFSVEV
jgi:heme-degrading monooxygenase HmoA